MESQGLFKGTFPLLEKALDLRSLKHNVTVSNIANKDTPNYKAFDLIVEEELEKVMGSGKELGLKKTHQGHLPGRTIGGGNVKLGTDNTSQLSLKRDGNTVDMDTEMAKLSENNLMYNTLAQIISKKFQGLNNVIQGGK
ncbi:MAG: flagellar basal body rod protein FlgB [Desulfobulbaceae bacterium]|nr:flagellar basal body rod protein FlgB [Desulfobulbaceae bacterium]